MSTLLIAQANVVSTTGPDLVPPLVRMTVAFLVVLAILAVLAWFMRKTLNARRSSGSITVETALSLGERRSIVIVTVENRRLLLGLAPGQVSLVTELQPPSFGQAMARATGEQVTR